MSNPAAQNGNVTEQASSSSSPQGEQQKDILVSIILSESTTNLLQLDLPRLEDLHNGSSQSTICTITAENSISQTNYSTDHKCFTEFWFGDRETRQLDCGRVLSEVAYLRSNPNISDSLASLEITQDQFCLNHKRLFGSSSSLLSLGMCSSTTSLEQRLKPMKVYIRPLFTVHSIAHQNSMQSEANNIYVHIASSQESETESGWVNVCRICHGGESLGDLLSPCDCRGSIRLAHLECLERWLRESANSSCELCQHHFHIVREPRYSVFKSILVFLRHPGEHLAELLFDLFAFIVYTPAAMGSTYMLMLLCESLAKINVNQPRNIPVHFLTFAAVFGMAAIDFTYSSWFMSNLQKHVAAWRNWYRNNCEVKVILPESRQKRQKTKK